jgi:hypothetical protein
MFKMPSYETRLRMVEDESVVVSRVGKVLDKVETQARRDYQRDLKRWIRGRRQARREAGRSS